MTDLEVGPDEFLIDGMPHKKDVEQCFCSRNRFRVCLECGKRLHFQGIYGGYIETCYGCDESREHSE